MSDHRPSGYYHNGIYYPYSPPPPQASCSEYHTEPLRSPEATMMSPPVNAQQPYHYEGYPVPNSTQGPLGPGNTVDNYYQAHDHDPPPIQPSGYQLPPPRQEFMQPTPLPPIQTNWLPQREPVRRDSRAPISASPTGISPPINSSQLSADTLSGDPYAVPIHVLQASIESPSADAAARNEWVGQWTEAVPAERGGLNTKLDRGVWSDRSGRNVYSCVGTTHAACRTNNFVSQCGQRCSACTATHAQDTYNQGRGGAYGESD